MTRIVDNIHIGGVEEARNTIVVSSELWGVVTVHENPDNVPTDLINHHCAVHWLPIMNGERGDNFHAHRRMLDAAAEVIRLYHEHDTPVFVHCGHGVERAPLTMAWYLKKFQICKSINAAYDLIEDLRPQIQRRTHWLDSP